MSLKVGDVDYISRYNGPRHEVRRLPGTVVLMAATNLNKSGSEAGDLWLASRRRKYVGGGRAISCPIGLRLRRPVCTIGFLHGFAPLVCLRPLPWDATFLYCRSALLNFVVTRIPCTRARSRSSRWLWARVVALVVVKRNRFLRISRPAPPLIVFWIYKRGAGGTVGGVSMRQRPTRRQYRREREELSTTRPSKGIFRFSRTP